MNLLRKLALIVLIVMPLAGSTACFYEEEWHGHRDWNHDRWEHHEWDHHEMYNGPMHDEEHGVVEQHKVIIQH